jgi:ceramide glucosyltransferase
MFGNLLLLCSVVGLLSCTAFLVLLAAAVFRFRRRALLSPFAGLWPSVSLLKPLHGLEPELEGNLESFFRQDYPRYEIIFGCREESDPALDVVQAVRRRYPHVAVKIVVCGEPVRPNARYVLWKRWPKSPAPITWSSATAMFASRLGICAK